jgi:hypothetical protein
VAAAYDRIVAKPGSLLSTEEVRAHLAGGRIADE